MKILRCGVWCYLCSSTVNPRINNWSHSFMIASRWPQSVTRYHVSPPQTHACILAVWKITLQSRKEHQQCPRRTIAVHLAPVFIYIYKTVRLFMVSMFFLGSSLKPSFTLVMFTTQSHLLFFCCSIFKGTLTGILARDGFSFTLRAHAFSGSLDICAGTIAARRFSNICIKAFFILVICAEQREKSHLAGAAL